jgi:hypothetical protein
MTQDKQMNTDRPAANSNDVGKMPGGIRISEIKRYPGGSFSYFTRDNPNAVSVIADAAAADIADETDNRGDA